MEPVKKPVRVILVGVGQRGKHWAQALHDEPDAQTVAYVDVDEGNLAWAKEHYAPPKGALFGEFQQALDANGEALL